MNALSQPTGRFVLTDTPGRAKVCMDGIECYRNVCDGCVPGRIRNCGDPTWVSQHSEICGVSEGKDRRAKHFVIPPVQHYGPISNREAGAGVTYHIYSARSGVAEYISSFRFVWHESSGQLSALVSAMETTTDLLDKYKRQPFTSGLIPFQAALPALGTPFSRIFAAEAGRQRWVVRVQDDVDRRHIVNVVIDFRQEDDGTGPV